MPQTPGLNPFLPFSVYVADGEPKLFGDRIYLYGSYDRFGEGYCSDCYHVFSAPLNDLTAWTDHGVSFTVHDVPWSDATLYAPDVLCHRGTYYLFFCLSDGTEGVAESAVPEGPFRNARQITLDGVPITGIDPSVLEDGDRIYYTWGQFHLSMGELNDDLCSLKPETVHRDVLSNSPAREGFHEGSSLRKIGERFCLVYASEYKEEYPNSGSRPTKLDYAISDAPYGPYRRRGTIIDNTGCDPSSWNNHGSILQWGDTWFVFYHASSNNCQASRRGRVEYLEVDEERCTIQEAKPTTNGFCRSLRPEHITSPVHAFRFFGGAYVTEDVAGRFPAVGLNTDAGFEFSAVQFDAGRFALSLDYKANTSVELKVLIGESCVIDTSLAPSVDWTDSTVQFETETVHAPLRFEVARADLDSGFMINSIHFEASN